MNTAFAFYVSLLVFGIPSGGTGIGSFLPGLGITRAGSINLVLTPENFGIST